VGSLKELSSQLTIRLEAENLIGRSHRCGIRLASTLASSVHASLRWAPQGWELKDLSSTNGSFRNGRKLAAGQAQLLEQGDILAFGATDAGWVLSDAAQPGPVVVSEDGNRAFGTELIAVPSSDEPLTTVYRTGLGTWCVEQPGGAVEAIANGGEFEAGGKRWRLFYPEQVSRTDTLHHEIRNIELVFTVSADEEHVELVARVAGDVVDLGARANNYFLLTLARQRREDERVGHDARNAGWMHLATLGKALASDPDHINVDVCRIRKRFERHFRNAAQIIERRPGTGQIRLGTACFQIIATAAARVERALLEM